MKQFIHTAGTLLGFLLVVALVTGTITLVIKYIWSLGFLL